MTDEQVKDKLEKAHQFAMQIEEIMSDINLDSNADIDSPRQISEELTAAIQDSIEELEL